MPLLKIREGSWNRRSPPGSPFDEGERRARFRGTASTIESFLRSDVASRVCPRSGGRKVDLRFLSAIRMYVTELRRRYTDFPGVRVSLRSLTTTSKGRWRGAPSSWRNQRHGRWSGDRNYERICDRPCYITAFSRRIRSRVGQKQHYPDDFCRPRRNR